MPEEDLPRACECALGECSVVQGWVIRDVFRLLFRRNEGAPQASPRPTRQAHSTPAPLRGRSLNAPHRRHLLALCNKRATFLQTAQLSGATRRRELRLGITISCHCHYVVEADKA